MATSPAANRTELAKTGLDPALIALLGAMCLGGGVASVPPGAGA